MKAVVIRKIIGAILICFGLCYLVPFASTFSRFWEDGFGWFTPLILVPMTLPGVIALVCGIQLIRKVSLSAIKWSVGWCVVMAGAWIGITLSDRFPDEITGELIGFTAILLVIISYSKILGVVLSWLELEPLTFSQSVSKAAIAILAFQLWMVLTACRDEFLPEWQPGDYPMEGPLWTIASGFAPVVIALIFYSVVSSKLGLGKDLDQVLAESRECS